MSSAISKASQADSPFSLSRNKEKQAGAGEDSSSQSSTIQVQTNQTKKIQGIILDPGRIVLPYQQDQSERAPFQNGSGELEVMLRAIYVLFLTFSLN